MCADWHRPRRSREVRSLLIGICKHSMMRGVAAPNGLHLSGAAYNCAE